MAHPVAARSSLAIDNLRAVVILLVVAFHGVLAYLAFLPAQPPPFDAAPFAWRSFPIIDHQRWFGFDLFCAWLDVFVISAFFLISGLFTWPSLSRKGVAQFLGDRLMRLGLPFAIGVVLLMPLAHYPVYLTRTPAPHDVVDFWQHWRALPLWPSGPLWFIWLLLACDLAAAAVYPLLVRRREQVIRLSSSARSRPVRFFAGFVLLSMLAYVPLALAFGASDWGQVGPLSFQLSRPLHYLLYFLAGALIGACGIERGLLASDGPLARRWRSWFAVAATLFVLWVGITAASMTKGLAVGGWLPLLSALSYVAACFASCFFALAAALRFGRWRTAALDSLRRNAYGIYLVHYGFVVWLQYAVLALDLPAVVKGGAVLSLALLLSWGTSVLLCRLPAVGGVIGAGGGSRRAVLPGVTTRSPGLAD